MNTLLDASALLAWARNEPGEARVRRAFDGGRATAVNWSEFLQKAEQYGLNSAALATRVRHAGVEVVPVVGSDGELAARLWSRTRHLSLADRLCLAVASRLGAAVLTADHGWRDVGDVADVEIEVIR